MSAPKRPAAGKKAQALELLAAGNSASHVSAALGVDRKTLYRWRQEPEFAEALERRISEQVSELRGQVRLLAAAALATYARALQGKDKVSISSIRAAADVLKTLGAIREPDWASERAATTDEVRIAFGGGQDEPAGNAPADGQGDGAPTPN